MQPNQLALRRCQQTLLFLKKTEDKKTTLSEHHSLMLTKIMNIIIKCQMNKTCQTRMHLNSLENKLMVQLFCCGIAMLYLQRLLSLLDFAFEESVSFSGVMESFAARLLGKELVASLFGALELEHLPLLRRLLCLKLVGYFLQARPRFQHLTGHN